MYPAPFFCFRPMFAWAFSLQWNAVASNDTCGIILYQGNEILYEYVYY